MLKKNSFLLRHRKKIIFISLFLVIVIITISIYGGNLDNKRPSSAIDAADREKATVIQDNISNKITGSGTIQSSSIKKISAEVSADVLDLKISLGDKVNAGDVLIELDKSDNESRIRELNKNISNLSNTVKSYNEDIKNLYVYATSDGYISNLNFEVGDDENKNSTICQSTDDEYYYITCEVNYNNNLNIKVGDSAKIMLIDTLKYLDGEVTYASDLKEISDIGTPFQTVEIKIKNPGYTLAGLLSSVTIYTSTSSIKSIKNVNISTAKSKSIKVQTSGTITKLNIRNGDYVNVGDLIMILENEDLYDDLSDAKSNLSDAYEDLENQKSNLDFYTIISPIDGIITNLNISVGDYVRSESELLTIVNNDNIEFDIEVDELDINDIELNQEVNVTIDAIEETSITPLKGTVTNISIEGTSMNSVTSYPFTISLTGSENIKMGMNCSAEIIIESKEDVLILPVESISTKKGKYFVTLVNGTETEVEVGMYDEDNIEIINGLSLGDEVLLPITIKNTSTDSKNEMKGGNNGFGTGMSGGMMGGTSMPGGGSFGAGRPNM